jgi:hypothetical protein
MTNSRKTRSAERPEKSREIIGAVLAGKKIKPALLARRADL